MSQWIKELGIYDYRHRYYQPELGRFLQTDPTGFDAGDMNLFRYCGDDPVAGSDPLGLYWDIRGSHEFVNKVLSQMWSAALKDREVANAIVEIRDSHTGHIVREAQDSRNPAPATRNGLKGNATRAFWGSIKAAWNNLFSSGSRFSQTWYNPDNSSLRNHPDRPPTVGLVHEIRHILDYERGTWTDAQHPQEAPVMEQRANAFENRVRPFFNLPPRDINDW